MEVRMSGLRFILLSFAIAAGAAQVAYMCPLPFDAGSTSQLRESMQACMRHMTTRHNCANVCMQQLNRLQCTAAVVGQRHARQLQGGVPQTIYGIHRSGSVTTL
jgi:hypothetical protein